MSASVLVDTNVLIYAEDADEPTKRERAREVIRLLVSRQCAAISAQVLGEYFVVLRRRFAPALDVETASSRVGTLRASMLVVDTTADVVTQAVRAAARYDMHFYDAQIWAAAKLAGVRVLLSEDFASGSEIEGVRFVNPFSEDFDLTRFAAKELGD
jgi:predicted nucleic acid-binding protein